MIPALLAGNAVILKPSHRCQKTAAMITALLTEHLPPHLFAVVDGTADAACELMSSGIDAVCFVGSEEAGRDVAAACARNFIPCSLEIGGKNSAIVLDDAPIERTARGIVWSAFCNAGQSSASIQRVFVVRSIADDIVNRIVAVTRTLRPGVDYGPIVVEERIDRVSKQLAQAVENGAEILIGGMPEPGSNLFPLTVVSVPNSDTSLVRDETFGPVLPIVPVDSAEQALEEVNRLGAGLAVSVWTGRTRSGRDLARRLRAGVVTVGNHGFTAAIPALPWASVGQSGSAVVHSPLAMTSYTRPKVTVIDRSKKSKELWWHPYDATLRKILLSSAMLRAGGMWKRTAAFFCLLVLIPKRWFGR